MQSLQRLVPGRRYSVWHPTGPRRSSEDHRGRRSPQGSAPKSSQVSPLHSPRGMISAVTSFLMISLSPAPASVSLVPPSVRVASVNPKY